MTVVETVKEKLTRDLEAIHVAIEDNTWMHAGHGASGSHLNILVVSPRFEGMPLMEQHRLVHQTLKEEMAEAIHAMQLKTMTPATWQKNQ